MKKIHINNHVVRKIILFVAVMAIFVFPGMTMAEITKGLDLAVSNTDGKNFFAKKLADAAYDTALTKIKSGSGVGNPDDANYLLQQALSSDNKGQGNSKAQQLIDAAQSVAQSQGKPPPQLTEDQTMAFAKAAIKDGNTWAQDKILDQIKNGKVSSEDIQRLKDAAGESDFKKKIEEAEKNQNPDATPPKDTSKLIKDRCYLIAPGMSLENGNMYGESGVKAFHDKYMFWKDLMTAKPECIKRSYPEPKVKGKSQFEYPTNVDVGSKEASLAGCIFATDFTGVKPAVEGSGEGKVEPGTGIESEANNKIREKQIERFNKNDNKENMFSVTMDTDLKAITATGANMDIRKGSPECPRISNESCIKEATKKNAEASGGIAIPSLGEGKAPTMKQHLQYWLETGATFITLPPPEKAGIDIRPGDCPVSLDKSHPTCQTNESASVVTKLVPDKPAADNNQKMDLFVSTDKSTCTYEKSDAKDTNKKSPFDWKDSKNGGLNGGSGGGGGGGMGDALQSLLPELMKALQGLGQGSGNQNSSATPTPTATPYVCATSSASEKVCGTDGVTYASRCVAEYENQVAVSHTGACTSSDTVSISSDSTISTLSALLQQLATSGMPSNMIESVTQAIVDLITRISTDDSTTTD